MRSGFVAAAICAFLCLPAAPSAASDETEIMQPIRHFFDAFARRDKAGMLAEVVAPDVEVMSERKGELRRLTVDALTDRVVGFKGGAIAEPIHDPVVHIDGPLGIVWARYEFTIDGKPDHCGTDVITLLRLQGRWQIVGLADNQHESCG